MICHSNIRVYAEFDNKFSGQDCLGVIITIMMKVVLAGNIYDVKSTELELVFVKGVSNSLRTNEMFAYLSRYAKE